MSDTPVTPGPATTRATRAAVVLLLAAQAGVLAWSAPRHSPAIDELGHMVAGINRWHFGRFDIYCVNPPLVSAVAAIPVVLSGPKTNWDDWQLLVRPEWALGVRFVSINGPERSVWYFTLARWACIPFALAGGYCCYRWARDLWGPASGLVALSLWAFSPTVLGNAGMITPDAPAAAAGVVAQYAFWRWLRGPSRRGALLAGLALGVAELCKMTWALLFGLWPLLWAAWAVPGPGASGRRPRRPPAAQLLAALLTGLYVLNAGYGFSGTFRRLDRYAFRCDALSGRASPARYEGNRFAGTWAGRLPVPLPSDYVRGVDLQKCDFERKMWSFLRGEHRLGGWWYYYLYALAIKEPLGTFALAALAAGLAARPPRLAAGWRDELVLLAPGVAVFALVSSQTGVNRNFRYVLPALPFFYIAVGRVGRCLARPRSAAGAAAAAALAWSLAGSAATVPHSMAYFNELVGGPTGGHHHLIDTNIDWGQDLLYLKRWAEDHPEARPLYVDTFGMLEPRHLAIPGSDPPRGRPPGWYAVSVHMLHEADGRYRDLLARRPDAMAGYSIYLFHVPGGARRAP